MADDDQQFESPASDGEPSTAAPERSEIAEEPVATPEENLAQLTGLDEQRLYAAFSYVFVLVLVPLLTRRGDDFVQWHAKQGLVLMIGFIIAGVAAAWINVLGTLLFLLLLVADIVGLVMALQGRKWKIPGIGVLAQKFNI